MDHSPGFLKLVNETRTRVHEINCAQAQQLMQKNPRTILIDVREDREWDKAHAEESVHLGKGILERDIEQVVPDRDTELIMYCGGGFRSVLTAEVAQRMGYTRVHSLMGGYKGMVEAGWPMAGGS